MIQEKNYQAMSGYGMLTAALVCLVAAIILFAIEQPIPAVPIMIAFLFIITGIYIVNPNEAKVLTLFGNYTGTAKQNGLQWANPFFLKRTISLRARNLNGQVLKVNDKIGNPIEIAAVIVWNVVDTAKATFEVNDYNQFVMIQSEAAVRHLAGSCPYDNFEDDNAIITLRGGGDKVNEMLVSELNERLAQAGIIVSEARISHLAYAPEIAGAMLQRQQATAIVSARQMWRQERKPGNKYRHIVQLVFCNEQDKMAAEKKAFVLRINPDTLKELEQWANDEFRSLNGQIEYLLQKALIEQGRSKIKGGNKK